jgi:hypothetical protein
MRPDIELALATFERARGAVARSASSGEVAWQRAVRPEHFTETDLLREAAWVILCSGFREATVRRIFGHVSLCFFDWESATEIAEAGANCVAAASAVFNHPRKLSAIVDVARSVERAGFAELKDRIIGEPMVELRRFPYIGEVTAWHLAKNLGFDVAKPDRHLVRLARDHGFADAHALCAALSHATGEPVRVVDLVLWRYAADRPVYDHESNWRATQLDSP